ncbi:hypothetical protein KY290_001498 [Solanum tuberosum]|uniref:Uncharacterized protein n=1 Tax=Solanum tuberosum TaxID=4113 RepID=A0ABQ7WMH0_SOLTU|nr:hypothetical protein KY290_001498 [Solanum tuberosum]
MFSSFFSTKPFILRIKVLNIWVTLSLFFTMEHVIVEEGGPTTSTVLGTFSAEKYIQELWDSSRASHPEDGINGTLNEGAGDDNEEENSYFLDFEEEDLDGVLDEDDSEVDEELRAFRENLRQEKRNEAAKSKERIKKSSKNQEVELGEADIDKEFENIFKNKEAKYIGRLRGNEEFIGSSDEPSEDSDEELDVLAQSSVDLPSRRKNKKLRYDNSCSISFFEWV